MLSLLGVAAAAGWTGCGQRPPATDAATAAKTLLVGNAAEPVDLDPPVTTAYTDMNILNALFEGLTFIEEESTKPIPATAERWEISDDGLAWTFHLRPTAKWSNGDPVVAEDFVQSFRRVVAPAMGFENASYLFPLKHAEAINAGRAGDATLLGARADGPHTLVLRLERPTPHLAQLTALTPWYPINPRVLREHDALSKRGGGWTRPGRLVGNGAFQLVEWKANAKIAAVKNPHYWNAADTALERIEFFPIEKPDAEERSFRSGQLHVTFTLPVTKAAAWRREQPAALRSDPFLQTTFVEFNTTKPPFNDARVRQAFALAIDRATLSRTALAGAYAAAAAATPPGTGGYTARAKAGHDAARAQALLTEAGFGGGRGLPALTLQVRNDELQPVVAEAIQAMWMQVLGVRVDITPLEQKTWLQNQRTLNYTLSTFSWVADFPDPLTFLGLFTSDHGNNWTGWKNPEYDRLIDQATTMSDAARRSELFQQAEAMLLEAMPLTPVYHGAQTYLVAPEVRNWVPAPLGIRRYQKVRLDSHVEHRTSDAER